MGEKVETTSHYLGLRAEHDLPHPPHNRDIPLKMGHWSYCGKVGGGGVFVGRGKRICR